MYRSLSTTVMLVLGACPLMAQQRVCGYCRGRGSATVDKRMYEPCKRCGGKGTTKTGKITVPCSACGGAGGKNRTVPIQQTCGKCGGTGLR
jgi:DnaJ-class molecular chaperone